jgi:hypothetical protein
MSDAKNSEKANSDDILTVFGYSLWGIVLVGDAAYLGALWVIAHVTPGMFGTLARRSNHRSSCIGCFRNHLCVTQRPEARIPE